jgi:hypothetical protein
VKRILLPLATLLVLASMQLFVSFGGCGTTVGMTDMQGPPDLVPPSIYSCDQETAMPPSCKEFSNLSASFSESMIQGLCPAPLAVRACSRTNLLGGCRATSSTYTLTTWFYSGGSMFTTSAQVQAYCGNAYVPPN